MKKIALMSLFALSATYAAFAQGHVGWSSIPFGSMTAQTNSQTYSPLFGGGSTGNGAVGSTLGSAALGTGYYYELLSLGGFNNSQIASPTSLSSLGNWSDTGLSATNNPVTAGRLSVVNPNAAATVSWSPGTTNYVMLVGWSANLGTNWSAALATLNSSSALAALSSPAFFGESATGYITPFDTATSPGAAVFGTAATSQGLPIFSLNTPLYIVPVPEPGTIALATLGGLSMLALRRRKA